MKATEDKTPVDELSPSDTTPESDAMDESSETDQSILTELGKIDQGMDLIQAERSFQDPPTHQELMRELNKTNVEDERHILDEIISRFTEPVRYKIKFYQIAVLMYIDQILTLFINKYMFFRVKVEQNLPTARTKLKIIRFQETRIKLDLLSKENLERTRLLVFKLNLKAENGFVKLQEMHHHCVSHVETPELFCEPYIHKGFRPINMPYSYYAKSLFTKHNESINAWSHYLGAVYTTYCAFTYDFSDPYSWPILVCLITSTIMFFSSATAHLMHQKSHFCHMTCFLCDFGGISFNAFGSSMMQLFYVSPLWYYDFIHPQLLPIIGIQSALCLLLNSIAQTNFKRPYPPIKRFLQFMPCGMLWTFSIIPLFLTYFFPDEGLNGKLIIHYEYHLGHIGLFLVGAFFFAADFPQRFFPGKLDFFGQGHNLFHLCIFGVVYLHIKACMLDYEANRELIAASRPPPTISFCFLSLIVMCVYYVVLIRKFVKMIQHNFDAEGNLIKKQTVVKTE